jgi:hypothetical protein
MKTTEHIVNESGYPLQIRIERWIEETGQQHRWRVAAREHRWVNSETGDEGYIDLILEREGWNVRLVVECKRIIGSWTFLVPMLQPSPDEEMKSLLVNYENFSFSWKKFPLTPASLEASFCVMETGGKKDSRIIEGLAGDLLLSMEQLAVQETNLMRPYLEKLNRSSQHILYLPVIVTTATIQTINFNPSDIDVADGKITQSTVSEVEFMRFRKNLASNVEYEKPRMLTLKDLNRENERSVLVIQAETFIDFLSKLHAYL